MWVALFVAMAYAIQESCAIDSNKDGDFSNNDLDTLWRATQENCSVMDREKACAIWNAYTNKDGGASCAQHTDFASDLSDLAADLLIVIVVIVLISVTNLFEPRANHQIYSTRWEKIRLLFIAREKDPASVFHKDSLAPDMFKEIVRWIDK